MEYFLQQLINGITLGSIYGLIAIGYTMVYGIIGMINFAHGDVFMVGSFIALMVIIAIGLVAATSFVLTFLALILVLALAMFVAGVLGWTIERIAYRPLRGSFRLAPLITAIGMSIMLQNYIQFSQGARVKPLQPIIQPLNVNDEFCGVAVTVTSVPSGKCAPRFVGQFTPGGSLVMIPWPVSVCTTSTSPTENQPVMNAWFSHW